MTAAYVRAHETGLLERRARQALRWMARCTLCPRLCRVNRWEDQRGYCRTGRLAVVASYGPHFGEEKPLVGRRGSGTIFFSHCNLYCGFCQNYDISHGGQGRAVDAGELADIMISLQGDGCHNINLVSPSHVIAPFLEALVEAVEKGLRIPIVYNTGGYDRASALRLLDGLVDIYMPDFKFWDPEVAGAFCDAPNYPQVAREALREMHRQVGDLNMDSEGVAQRGLLVRHLVMPDGLAGTKPVLHFIATELSPRTYVNVMSQYHPCGMAVGSERIGRPITEQEFADALRIAREQGLTRLDDRHRHWITIEL